jgi:hypothetical protein
VLRTVALLALATLAVAAESEPPAVTIEAVDPAGTSSLGRGDAVSVRLAYRSAVPVRFRLAAFARGEPITDAQSNPLPLYPAGQGEAIAWLARQRPGYVDELRVGVLDAQWQPLDELSLGVSLFWEGEPPSAPRTAPPWVARLNAVQQAMVSADAAARPNEPGFDGASVVVMAMGWSVPVYLVLQIVMVRRYRGGWRRAALAPLLLTVPLAVYTAGAFAAGSNLWPLMLILLTPVACLYLLALWLLRRVRGRARA